MFTFLPFAVVTRSVSPRVSVYALGECRRSNGTARITEIRLAAPVEIEQPPTAILPRWPRRSLHPHPPHLLPSLHRSRPSSRRTRSITTENPTLDHFLKSHRFRPPRLVRSLATTWDGAVRYSRGTTARLGVGAHRRTRKLGKVQCAQLPKTTRGESQRESTQEISHALVIPQLHRH